MRCRAENRITDASSNITYLEVLTAQQSLLEAEVQQLQTRFERIQSESNFITRWEEDDFNS